VTNGRATRRTLALRVAGAAAVAAVAAFALPGGGDGAATTVATAPGVIGLVPASPTRAAAPARPRPSTVARTGPVPVRVEIPRIGVRSTLERLTVGRTGELGAPRDPRRAGWFVDGAVPGEVGPAVIAGHVDASFGPAVFWRLSELRRGDLVTVTRSDGAAARFRVVELAQHPRDAFPTARVYGPTPEVGLRLITCAGRYDRDRGEYRDNIVVYAVRA
jgi:hypothetical protein